MSQGGQGDRTTNVSLHGASMRNTCLLQAPPSKTRARHPPARLTPRQRQRHGAPQSSRPPVLDAQHAACGRGRIARCVGCRSRLVAANPSSWDRAPDHQADLHHPPRRLRATAFRVLCRPKSDNGRAAGSVLRRLLECSGRRRGLSTAAASAPAWAAPAACRLLQRGAEVSIHALGHPGQSLVPVEAQRCADGVHVLLVARHRLGRRGRGRGPANLRRRGCAGFGAVTSPWFCHWAIESAVLRQDELSRAQGRPRSASAGECRKPNAEDRFGSVCGFKCVCRYVWKDAGRGCQAVKQGSTSDTRPPPCRVSTRDTTVGFGVYMGQEKLLRFA